MKTAELAEVLGNMEEGELASGAGIMGLPNCTCDLMVTRKRNAHPVDVEVEAEIEGISLGAYKIQGDHDDLKMERIR